RDTVVQTAPQPVAEAMLELAAAGTPEAAWDAATRVVQVLVRVAGVIALAARARIGARGLGPAAERVRNLVDRGLDLDQWVKLTAALVEPFAEHPDAHPVPDLVRAYRAGGEVEPIVTELVAIRSAADAVDA